MPNNAIEQFAPTSAPTHLTHETLALLREKFITDDLIEIIQSLSGQVAFLDEKLAANEKNNELLAAENATLQRENEGLRKKLAELGALILQLTQTS